MRRTPIKTGTQLIFPVLRIGDFFSVFVRYQIVINSVFSYFNWVITQIRSLIKVLLQRVIDCLGSWARKWGMRFQPIKCNMMQLTNKRSSKIQANYTLEGTVLENVESIKYLGVTIDTADNAAYPHDGRADKRCYRHDRRADKRRYPHDREIDIQMLKMSRNRYILS